MTARHHVAPLFVGLLLAACGLQIEDRGTMDAAAEESGWMILREAPGAADVVAVGDERALRRVLDEVLAHGEAGGNDTYWVRIMCPESERLLATGRAALTTRGSTQSGLATGDVVWRPQEDLSCP